MTDQESKSLPADSQPLDSAPTALDEQQHRRRDFLVSLGRWSKAVIGGVLLGGGLLAPDRDAKAVGWGNRGGGNGSWVNLGGGGWGWGGGGGGGWVNLGGGGWGGGGGWYNTGGWYDRPWNNRGWYDRPWNNRSWHNGGWYNGGGGGGSWYNR
jgi:hypothetical protein